MLPEITIFSVIMLIGGAHGLFLVLILLLSSNTKGNGRSLLAFLVLAFTADLGHEFLYQSRYLLHTMDIAFLDPWVNLLYGPLLYLYARNLTYGSEFKTSRHLLLHLFPALLAMAICVAMPNLTSGQFHDLYYADQTPQTPLESYVQQTISAIALSSVVSVGLYILLGVSLLIRHRLRIQQEFSSLEKITLDWLSGLFVALSVLYLALIFDGFFSDAFGLHERFNNFLYILIVCVIYAMGYLGLRQPAIFSRSPVADSVKLLDNTSDTKDSSKDSQEFQSKYQKSALDSGMSSALSTELSNYMQQEKPFLESQLTLTELAAKMNISANYLSQVINEQFEMNYFDYINRYRVEEAKCLLDDATRSHKIIDIAYQSGFNSKSAFYTAFKKHVGITPTKYRARAGKI